MLPRETVHHGEGGEANHRIVRVGSQETEKKRSGARLSNLKTHP